MKKIALVMLSLIVALPFYVSPAFAASYTAQDVAARNTASNCWAIAGNNVYNLTSLVTAHPGGSAAIIGLCGTDATNAFNAVHGNSDTAKAALASVLIGTLATSSTDTSAPTMPTNLMASVISSSQINLSWTASTDNMAVSGYNIYRGGNLIGTSTSPVFNNTGLTASTSYSYMVSAFDAMGNVSVKSTPVSGTTLAMSSDNTPPTMPTNLVASIDSDHQVVLSWTASTDNIGVAGYNIMRNGEFLDTSHVANFIDTTTDPDTTYTYSVSAFDVAGNHSIVSSVISVDTPPVIENDSEDSEDISYDQNDDEDMYCDANNNNDHQYNNDWKYNKDWNQESNDSHSNQDWNQESNDSHSNQDWNQESNDNGEANND